MRRLKFVVLMLLAGGLTIAFQNCSESLGNNSDSSEQSAAVPLPTPAPPISVSTVQVTPGHVPFSYTGAAQSFVIPAEVTSITVKAWGAGGGGGSGFATGTPVTLTPGSGTTAPNTTDSDYVAGVGVGGMTATSSGGNGLVVISWISTQIQ